MMELLIVTVAERRRWITGVSLQVVNRSWGVEVWLLRRWWGVWMKTFSCPSHAEVFLIWEALMMRIVSLVVVVRDSVGRKHARMMKWSTTRRILRRSHEPQLVHPLLLAPLVLEPHLDHSHAQACVLGQLFSHQSGGFGILIEDILQHLQLLGCDVSPGSSSLAILAFFLVISLLVIIILLVRLIMLRLLWWLGEWFVGAGWVIDNLHLFLLQLSHEVGVVLLAVDASLIVLTHLHPLLQHLAAPDTLETLEVILVSSRHPPHLLPLTEHLATASTHWRTQRGIVRGTVESALVTVAGAGQRLSALVTPDTGLMVALVSVVSYPHDILILDDQSALGTLHDDDVVLDNVLGFVSDGLSCQHDCSAWVSSIYWVSLVSSHLLLCDHCFSAGVSWPMSADLRPLDTGDHWSDLITATKKWCFPWFWSTWGVRQRHRQHHAEMFGWNYVFLEDHAEFMWVYDPATSCILQPIFTHNWISFQITAVTGA